MIPKKMGWPIGHSTVMLCNQFSIFIVFLKLHAGQVTRKKFRLIAIEKDLQFLEEEGFPLPETISLDQWEQLMLLENTFARNKYFDVMFTENNLEPLKDEQFEKILEDDKSRVGPLRLDQEVRQLWLFAKNSSLSKACTSSFHQVMSLDFALQTREFVIKIRRK